MQRRANVADKGHSYGGKWQGRRLSRRRLLTGAAGVGAGLAAISLVGCGGGEEESSRSPVASLTGSPAASPTTGVPENVYHRWGAGPPPPLEPATARGGVLRWFGLEPLTLDTFDPHQTQFGPLFSTHAAVFSKVLKYDDPYLGVMAPDLADSMPESPDKLTYVIRVRPGVRFHDTEKIREKFPEVAGRELTAEDMKYSIERQLNKESPRAALYQHMSQWEAVDRIEVVDPLTLKITTKRPTAPFLHYLADTNAFVIPKELIDPKTDDMNSADKMIGTGPFMLDKFVSLQVVRAVRNPDWFAKDDAAGAGLADRPILDGFEAIWKPEDETSIEIAFKTKQVDDTNTVLSNATVDRIAAETGTILEEWMSSSWVASRLLIADSEAAASPLKDLRLRQAINIAVDRSRMAEGMFQSSYLLGSPVAQAIGLWALPLEELTKKKGYRFKREERQEDLVEAKQMWEAAGGPSIGSMEVTYAAIPTFLKAYYPQLERQLKEVLGLEVKGHLDATGYTEIAQGLFQKRLVFTFSYDNGWIELDDYLYPYFHSDGPKNSFNVSDSTLDQMLDAQREEFDFQRRQQLGYDIQNYLLDNVVARLDWISEIERGVRWAYTKNVRRSPWLGDTYQLVNTWMDSSDPTFQGRAA
jgi:ABC-type transport system substrate-binding protein